MQNQIIDEKGDQIEISTVSEPLHMTRRDPTLTETSAELRPVTAEAVRQNMEIIQEVLKSVMIEGTHYGVIPGTQNKSLFKAGAEKILATFRIAAVIEVTEISTPDCYRYRVIVKGVHQTTGLLIGTGVGEGSTNEDKYKWRAAACQEEFNETPDGRRRAKWKKGYNQPNHKVQQVRTEPADLANTVLKMAKKRALVDLALTATAASDVFDQDAGDGVTSTQVTDKPIPPKVSKRNGGTVATVAQVNLMRNRLKNAGIEEVWLCNQMKVEHIELITMSDVDDALKAIQEAPKSG